MFRWLIRRLADVVVDELAFREYLAEYGANSPEVAKAMGYTDRDRWKDRKRWLREQEEAFLRGSGSGRPVGIFGDRP